MTVKILMIDDSATSRALFKACFFGNNGFEIIEAQEKEDGLRKAKQHQPDIIVLDYNMPDINGVMMAKYFQQHGVEAKYVLLTANTQAAVVKEAKENKFVEVVEKPITAESIQNLMDKLA